jgi:hypothetical protein
MVKFQKKHRRSSEDGVPHLVITGWAVVYGLMLDEAFAGNREPDYEL